MRVCLTSMLAIVCLALLALPAYSQQPEQPAPEGAGTVAGSAADEQTPPVPDMVALAEAYQKGYLQVVAIACFQLYSSSGIIATDFSKGNIDAVTALDALDEDSLLHSACYTTLMAIQELTPPTDSIALAEIAKLLGLLTAEDELITALDDVITDPTADKAAVVEAARTKVEQTLDSYMQNAQP
jgi:hypothetical protein